MNDTERPEPPADAVEAAAEAIRSTADAFFSGREVEQITSVKSAKQAFDRLYRQQARAALQAAAEPKPGLDAVLPDDTVAVIIERANRHGKRTNKWGAKLITDGYEHITDPHDSADKALFAAVRQAKENGDG